jgi:hypothetical protein
VRAFHSTKESTMIPERTDAGWKTAALALAVMAGPVLTAQSAVEFLDQPARGPYRLNVDEAFARHNVQRGYGLLREILDGDYDLLAADRQADGLDVVAVLWALYDAAARKGQAYDQGSFMVEDPRGYLVQFLLGNNRATVRRSSHLKRATRLANLNHYGIDILGGAPSGGREWTPYGGDPAHFRQQNILPAQKGTILFVPLPADRPRSTNPAGEADRPGGANAVAATAEDRRLGLRTAHVFIKMEDNGLQTWSGYLNHALDFVSGEARKLVSWGGGGVERKERVAEDLTDLYDRMMASLHVPANVERVAHARELGLRTMKTQAEIVQRTVPDGTTAQVLASRFLDRLGGLDHQDVRSGYEVVFSEAELRAAAGDARIERAPRAEGDGWLDAGTLPAGLDPAPAPASGANPNPPGWSGWARSWLGW